MVKKFSSFLLLGICGFAWAQEPSSYSFDDRLHDYLHRTYGWQRFATSVAETGIDQLLNDPKEWGRGADGFSYRYGSALGRRMVRNTLEFGLGALLHEDTRFTTSGLDGFGLRLRHALFGAFLTSDAGGGFSYSRLGATVGTAVICQTWQPPGLSAGRVFGGIGSGYGSYIGTSLLMEFKPEIKNLTDRLRFKLLHR